jgi:hypothetical protein
MLAQAMWTHGTNIIVEVPQNIQAEWRAGFFTRLTGKPGTTNWLHFAIPTTVIVNDNRLAIDSALLRFRSNSNRAVVTNVHVYDGERLIAGHNNLSLAPVAWNMHRFAVPGRPEILWGVGISIGVSFSGTTADQNTFEFSSAGADFLP